MGEVKLCPPGFERLPRILIILSIHVRNAPFRIDQPGREFVLLLRILQKGKNIILGKNQLRLDYHFNPETNQNKGSRNESSNI